MVRVETFLRSFTYQDVYVYVFSLMSFWGAFPSRYKEFLGFSVHSLRARSTLAEMYSPPSLLFIHNQGRRKQLDSGAATAIQNTALPVGPEQSHGGGSGGKAPEAPRILRFKIPAMVSRLGRNITGASCNGGNVWVKFQRWAVIFIT